MKLKVFIERMGYSIYVPVSAQSFPISLWLN